MLKNVYEHEDNSLPSFICKICLCEGKDDNMFWHCNCIDKE